MAKDPKRPSLELDRIEAEGRAAGDEAARKLFNEILRNGGRIDWSGIARGGPTVARALLSLSVEAAARKLDPRSSPSRPPGRPKPNPRAPKTPLPRVVKNWRDLREEPSDYRWSAFLQGTIGAAAISLIATAIIRVLNN